MSAAYRVLLKHIPTGEVVEVDHGEVWGDSADYLWTDGNWGCDCNRALLFARAKGLPEPAERPCGEDRYIAIRAIGPDGWTCELEDENWTPGADDA